MHAVYEAIAPHFSATRHKPWPFVAQFLRAQPPGSVGLDVGCGNGKYLRVNPDLHLLGSDRSAALVHLAWEGPQPQPPSKKKKKQNKPEQEAAAVVVPPPRPSKPGDVDVAIADGLSLPYRASSADFAICIAVIHHLSTPARRRAAIAALLACVRPRRQGRVLVYVWALEQSSSRRGWDSHSDQDTLVPWVLKSPPAAATTTQGEQQGQGPREETTFQRYYHLYREGELEEDVVAAGGVVEESGYERDNWWVICSRPS